MPRNKKIIIIISSLILIAAITAAITEYREVSTYEWKETYSFSDELPQGLYIFKELVNRYYKNVPCTLDAGLSDSTITAGLFIQFSAVDMDDIVIDSLLSIASRGNDVLIIEDFFNNRIADTMPQYFDKDYTYEKSIKFNFTDPSLTMDSNYVYHALGREFNQNQKTYTSLLKSMDWENDQPFIRVVTPDSLALMISFSFGKGRLFYHMNNELFYNHSYGQTQMFEYTQKLLSHFQPKHVYLLTPKTIYNSGNPYGRNPLEFIMAQPALKSAYYLLILGALLFAFFGGKRKQKIIPVLEKNENTSLEYIETVSQLFYEQDQHEKLVAHIKNIFYHKMQKKFFVTPDDPNYVKVLAKKSKISVSELQYIMDRFKNLEDDYAFRGDQLVSLNRRLEKIYREMEGK